MDRNSPYYQFDSDSPGWLARKAETEGFSLDDVARVVEANPEVVPDAVMRDFIVRGLRGELWKKPGPKFNIRRELMLNYAAILVPELLSRLTARAKRQRAKGIRRLKSQLSPADRAYHVIARRLRLGSGPSLRNELSKRKYLK